MTDLGSGIRLGSDFDFVVDTSGDLDDEQGLDELHKDLALAVAEVLTTGSTEKLTDTYDDITIPNSIGDEGGVVGIYLSSGVITDVEVLVANLIDLDPRIDTVLTVEARQSESDPDTLIVEATAQIEVLAEEENFEFVVPAS